MESEVASGRSEGILGSLGSWRRANRKAKMLLELLGFRSAASLPSHLHSAILQVLLLGPVGPFSTRPASRGAASVAQWSGQLLPLRSEGCAIQCLFAAWLTKTSKWLKAPRCRYVMVLAVTPQPGCLQKPQAASSGSSSPPVTATADRRSYQPECANMSAPMQKEQQQQEPRFSQLLLVAFKAPTQTPLGQGEQQHVGVHRLQRAEPSETFIIDNTHRAICQHVPSENGDQCILVIQGLGGRLLVLGEPSLPAASPPIATTGQTAGRSPLEELANLINAAAPFCAPPRRSRWEDLLQLFAAAAISDGLGPPTTIEPLTQGIVQWKEEDASTKTGSSRSLRAGTGHVIADCPGSSEAEAFTAYGQRRSLSALLIRCSLAACQAICRPLTVVLRLPASLSWMPAGNTGSTNETSDVLVRGCSECGFRQKDGFLCTRKECSYGWSSSVLSSGWGNGHVAQTRNPGSSRHQRTLRQLIDDQQRAVAAFAVRERCSKVALVQQEHQVLHQQASRALMDEQGQLFPHARRWLDSMDGQLLRLCLTGHKWRPPASPRS